VHDKDLQTAIRQMLERAKIWLWSMQEVGKPKGVLKISAAQDSILWPGMLLPGSYNGLQALHLIGGLDALTNNERDTLAVWFLKSQQPDGTFQIQGMKPEDTFKKSDPVETKTYIDFHVSNYSLGALEAIGRLDAPVLDFVTPYLRREFLEAWLCRRDLRDPWLEGNNIVNLASFLLLKVQTADPDERKHIADSMAILFDWHDRNQEPSTGFWGMGQAHDATMALHAMAGSMHNFHLYYECNRHLPYQDRAIDYALSQAPHIVSACIDVDLVDLLVHGHDCLDYRRSDIAQWLRALLPHLLAFQNPDGGFCDEQTGTRRQDGWVNGYQEPQGLSNTFATWFRLIAIAMIADCLWPQWLRWNFRRMIGIGYRKAR
jgi:phage protein U